MSLPRKVRLLRGAGGALLLGLLASWAAPCAQAADFEIRLSIKDHHFVPEAVTAPVGQRIKFIVRNEDSSVSEFESVDFHREKIVQPGQQITVFVGPLEAGNYEFFDDFHPEGRGLLSVK
jgi:plastocyanin